MCDNQEVVLIMLGRFGCDEEEVGLKVVGSNPGAGKVFSRKVSVKYYLLLVPFLFNACVR